MPQTPPVPRRARRCRSHQSLLHRSSGQATAARSRMSSEVRLSPAATRPVPMRARRSQLTRATPATAAGLVVVAAAVVATITPEPLPVAIGAACEPTGAAGEVPAGRGAGVNGEPMTLDSAGTAGADVTDTRAP